MAEPKELDVIFLDFDGVIVESNGIKNRAFEEIFSRYPERRDELMSYHLSNNHVARGAKFEHVAREILEIDDVTTWVFERVSEFTAMTRKAVIECPFVGGAEAFLLEESSVQPLVIVSATPLEELELILHARSIRRHFHSVHGAPESKPAIFERVLRENGWRSAHSLFLGDSAEDLISSRAAGIPFLGVVGNSDFEGEGVPVVLDLEDAGNWLRAWRAASA